MNLRLFLWCQTGLSQQVVERLLVRGDGRMQLVKLVLSVTHTQLGVYMLGLVRNICFRYLYLSQLKCNNINRI